MEYLSAANPPLVEHRPGYAIRDENGVITESYQTRLRLTQEFISMIHGLSKDIFSITYDTSNHYSILMTDIFIQHKLPLINLRDRARNSYPLRKQMPPTVWERRLRNITASWRSIGWTCSSQMQS